MSTIGKLLQGAANYLRGPTPDRAQELRQQQTNLKTSIKNIDAEIGRLEPGGWNAEAKAARQRNAPRVTELRTQRAQLSDQLLTVEKELLGSRAAYSQKFGREFR